MRYIKTIFQMLNENDEYTIVYRGEKNNVNTKPYLWVTRDEEYANVYGVTSVYKMPDNLNILDTDSNYTTFDKLICNYEEVEYDEDDSYENDEYKFEPPIEFINFLAKNGYDGFEHETSSGDNILIFDSTKLIKM